MYLFHNDYCQGCHPQILERLQQLQDMQLPGYGVDDLCNQAAEVIRQKCCNKDLAVHFLVGGTQTNLTVIAAALRPHHAVLAADSAHIHVHETGAVEATGHKIVALPSKDGKITAQQIEDYIIRQDGDDTAEHAVKVKMVYISDSTELGTIYTKSELTAISNVCRQHDVYLFVDGARLGYALTAEGNDLDLADMASLTDVFYIGGTKVGALFGEAVVISNSGIAEDFRYLIKQHGGMLAKGWLLGLQFLTLLQNDLYFDIASHANRMADQIRNTITECGYALYLPGTTNQIFATIPNKVLDDLSSEFTFQKQAVIDEQQTAVRFCTSWSTTQNSVDALCKAIRATVNKEV